MEHISRIDKGESQEMLKHRSTFLHIISFNYIMINVLLMMVN